MSMVVLRAALADGRAVQGVALTRIPERLLILADPPQLRSPPVGAQRLPLVDRPEQVYRGVCEFHEKNVPSSTRAVVKKWRSLVNIRRSRIVPGWRVGCRSTDSS